MTRGAKIEPRTRPGSTPLARRLVAVLLTVALATALHVGASDRSDATDGMRRSLEAAAAGVVQIDHATGTLVVEGWDQPRVEVTGRVDRDSDSTLLERRGERVLVRLDPSRLRGRSADLEVRVPAASRLEIHGMNLDVRVSGVGGDLDVDVVSGTIWVRGSESAARLETVSGVVQAEGSFRELEMLAVSGPVELDGRAEVLTTETSNGPQDLRVTGARRVEVDSLNGPIRLELRQPAAGLSVEGRTFNGRLQLALERDLLATVTATARSGRVENRLGGREERDADDDGGARLVTRLGSTDGAAEGKSARIALSTRRGDIVLLSAD